VLPNAQKGNAEIIEKVVALLRERVPEEKIAETERFIRQYYRRVEADDLAERNLPDICCAALAHLDFMRVFKAGAAKVRVYNPQSGRDGWQSTHTVVEIVNDDMPFLVDSVTMEINRLGLATHLTVHPVMRTRRDAAGGLLEILPSDVSQSGPSESVMHVEVDRQTAPEKLAELEAGISRILGDVHRAVEDYPRMKEHMNRVVAEIGTPYREGLIAEVMDEDKAFLKWLADQHFIFLGYRDYDLVQEGGEDVLRVVPGSGLGILRERPQHKISKSFATVTPEAKSLARTPDLLILTKANSRSTVHRQGYLDYIGVKRLDAKGQVLGEQRFLGLFTSTAYASHPTDIPLLRRKVNKVIARAGLDSNGHMERHW